MKKVLKDPLVYILLFAFGLFVRLVRSARNNEVHWSSLTVPASYLIGSVASMWMFERVVGYWA
jgi:hypothetical protein